MHLDTVVVNLVSSLAISADRRAHHNGTAGGGYLANLSPSEFAQHYEEGLPEQMTGADFTAECGDHWDFATQVLPLPLHES